LESSWGDRFVDVWKNGKIIQKVWTLDFEVSNRLIHIRLALDADYISILSWINFASADSGVYYASNIVRGVVVDLDKGDALFYDDVPVFIIDRFNEYLMLLKLSGKNWDKLVFRQYADFAWDEVMPKLYFTKGGEEE